MDNLTKETRKTLPYGKSRATAYYALASPWSDGFRLAFRMYSNEQNI
jgi:hypothetical protein